MLDFTRDGAAHVKAALKKNEIDILSNATAHLPQDRAGTRLIGIPTLTNYLRQGGVIAQHLKDLTGKDMWPVRAVLFDKNPEMNWKLKWHQDRTIVVKERIEKEDYGPWSIKAGLQHVAPPYDVLARMRTVRIHFDDVDATNAPLLVALGSHQWGRVEEKDIPHVVERCEIHTCLAKEGDIWIYHTPILHASDAAIHSHRRRVLQVDYAAEPLSGGLEWLGI